MLFRFLVNLIYGLLIIVNGRLEVIGKENLPDKDTYVLVAPGV